MKALLLLLTLPTLAAAAPDPAALARGEALFHRPFDSGWSCATCHTADPRQPGRHRVTGRALQPLAPAVNPARFSDAAKVDKWFRRNCRDVLGRECSAQEKADLTAWLRSLPAETQP